MTSKEASKEQNPLIYYSIILITIGIIAYNWLRKIDKAILMHDLIVIGLALLAMLWLLAIIIFSVRGYMLQYSGSKIMFKILIHLANLIIIAIFIYRLTLKIVFDYSFMIHGMLAIIIISYYNFAFHKYIFEKKEERKKYQQQIELEQKEVKKYTQLNLNSMSIEELHSTKEELETKIFLRTSSNLLRLQINNLLIEIDKVIEEKNAGKELKYLREQKEKEKKELEHIQREKRNALMDKESKKAERIYDLTHTDDNVILSNRLTREEKKILKGEGFKQVNEYCAHQKRVITTLIKPVLNHSPTHTFLVWSVKQALKDFNVENIITHDTRDADITFKHSNRRYAIEIETGNLLKKQKQLEQKVKYLNKQYPNRWIFVVSNRNLQAKYNKYGISTQRNRVSEILTKMLENTHPQKLGVKTKTTTKNIPKKSLE